MYGILTKNIGFNFNSHRKKIRKYIKKQANYFSVENNMVSLKYKSKHLLSLLVVKKRKL